MKRFSILALMCFVVAPFLNAQEKGVGSFWDRSALKTNAFEWLITIPNVGFEYDVVRDNYRKMSVGLTAKYNWNSYHRLTPSTAFDLFDVRPEFRYYMRTDNKKYSRRWWAIYMGPYLSYGTYTFKLAPKGIHGYAVGGGASVGYVCPLYEYEKGAIDVEFGFSVGLQGCTRDVFTYNPEGYYYTKVKEQSKGMHFTPFPVVSELKVAFVWRKQSIAHQVKIYEEKNDYNDRRKESFKKYESSIPQYLNETLFYNSETMRLKDMIVVVNELDSVCVQSLGIDAIGQFEAEIKGVKDKYVSTLDSTGRRRFDRTYAQLLGRMKKIGRKEADRLVSLYNRKCTPSGIRSEISSLFDDAVQNQLPESLIYTSDGKNLRDTASFYYSLKEKCGELKGKEINALKTRLKAARQRYLVRPAVADSSRYAAFKKKWCTMRCTPADTMEYRRFESKFDEQFGWYLSAFSPEDSAKFMLQDSLMVEKLKQKVDKRRKELEKLYASTDVLIELEEAAFKRFEDEIESQLPVTLFYDGKNLRSVSDFHADVNNRCDVVLNTEKFKQLEEELDAIQSRYPSQPGKKLIARSDYVKKRKEELKSVVRRRRNELMDLFDDKLKETENK